MPTGANPTRAIFEGVGVALVTLLDDRGELDAAATARLAARLVAAGITGVLVAGTTGEAGQLTPQERRTLIGAVREAVAPAGVPVLAGTGAQAEDLAVGLTRDAVDAGADAVMAFAPPGLEEIAGYYGALGDAAGDAPVYAYHIPSISLPGVAVEALGTLDVAGIKDSSGDLDRLEREVALPLAVYVGSSKLTRVAGERGCAGVILASANFAPETCVAAFGGDADAQRTLTALSPPPGAALAAWVKEQTARRFATPARSRVG